MATLIQILTAKWPGARWSINDPDGYATLVWKSLDVPKPTEAEIRSFSAEVDAAWEAHNSAVRRDQALLGTPGETFDAIEALTEMLGELIDNLQPSALKGGLNRGRLNALKAKLNNART